VKFPLASTAPHSEGHAGPDTLQRTTASGCALLAIDARKFWVAPSSTDALDADKLTRTSLVIDTAESADFVASA